MKKFTLTLTVVLLGIAAVFAQSPEAFKYQAVARDSDGNNLINQNVSFQISILLGSETGSSVFTETHSLITNDFGLISLEIGNGTHVSGDFSTIGWGGSTYYLNIEMDESGGDNYQQMGVSQLLSVPYALHAGNSGDDGDWTVSGDDMYSAVPGNVGIGTSSPSGLFEVYKQGAFGNDTVDQEQTTLYTFYSAQTLFWQSFTAGTTGYLTKVEFYEHGSSHGSFTMKIYFGQGTGGVLLCTSDTVIRNNSGSEDVSFDFSNPIKLNSGQQYTFAIQPTNGANWEIGMSESNNYSGGVCYYYTGVQNNDFRFKTYMATAITDPVMFIVNNDANVGIGTTSPTEKLHIEGNIRIVDGNEGDGKVLISDAEGTAAWQDASLINNDWTVSGDDMYSSVTGNVGIGTTNPTTDLHISGGTNSVSLLLEADTDNSGEADQPELIFVQDGGLVKTRLGYFDSNNAFSILQEFDDDMHFFTDSINRMTIRANGKIGMGTTSPEGFLHVHKPVTDNSVADQQQLTGSSGVFYQNFWQSITAGITGYLKKITLWNDEGFPGDFTMKIYEGEGISGTLLSTQSFTGISDPGWITCVFSNPPIITSGNQYTFFVSGGIVDLGMTYSNPYAGGYFNESGNDHINWDAKFETFVTTDNPFSEDFVFSNDGNVGIGTTSPENKLDVIGNVGIDGNTDINGNIDVDGNAAISGDVSIDGNVGLGITNPSAKLHIKANNSSWDKHIRLEDHDSDDYANILLDGDGLKLRTFSDGGNFYFRDNDNNTSLYIEDGGKVGIGTTSPAQPLHVIGDTEIGGGSLNYDGGSEYLGIEGKSEKWYRGVLNSDEDVSNFFIGLHPTDDGIFCLQRLNNFVGINTDSPNAHLSVNGNATKPGGGDWLTFSDKRLKDIKGDYTKGLDEIMQLHPVVYSFKKDNPKKIIDSIEYIGFIAQEVQEIFPEAVSEGVDGYLMLDMQAANVAIFNALKQLKEQNDLLKEQNDMIQTNNMELEKRIESLEKGR